jgi:hypothetical protein
MLDDVKSWIGKKGFVTKNHTIITKAYRSYNVEHFNYIYVSSNEQCQQDVRGLTSL